jgi:uroporphyrinogen decarboxylase
MTSRERVITAFKRQPPDRVPAVLYGELVGYVPAITALLEKNCGGKSPLEYFNFDITSFPIKPPAKEQDFARYLQADEKTTVDEWGVGWKRGSYLHYFSILHPLEGADYKTIEAYPFPDLDREYRYSDAAEKVRETHEKGLAAAFFAGSIFETAWFMRGMDQLFVDIMTEPKLADLLLDRITDIVAAAAFFIARAGTDLLILGDDIAMQTGMLMSLDMWRAVFKPRLKRVIDAARKANPDIFVFYHSDGNLWDAIPELIEVGVDVLNPVQPECMDPAEVKREFGKDLSFLGSVSIQETLPKGTPEDVRQEVKLRMETIGRGGGLLIAPAHVLQPDTPWENIAAFFDAVEEFGYY